MKAALKIDCDQDTEISVNGTRVAVIVTVRLFREAIVSDLARHGMVVVGSAAGRVEALDLIATLKPTVVVLDVATECGFELVRAIKDATAGVKVVAVAVEDHEPEIIACAEAGVDGYVHCDGSIEDLTSTIVSVTRGELLCSPKAAATLLRRVGALASSGVGTPRLISGLTSRELEVLGLIHRGLSNKEIASQLRIEVATAKNHVHNLLEKLQVTSRAQAAARLVDRAREYGRRPGLASFPSTGKE
jgi:two-component system, NarL family, nitrate/nitrite response regulator NarL